MQPDRWGLVKELLAACLELDPAERANYLDRTCGHDAALRAELESLIASYDQSGDPLDDPEPVTVEEAEAAQVIGRRVGPYRILEAIGEGGMSRVYLGIRSDDAFRKKVAVKLVKRGIDYEFILRRFRNERQIMAGLEHPNIARLLDGGATEDGMPYFVMEYIQGRPIDRHCDEHNLSVRERLELFLTVCSAVEYAHERRIIHRDIKPENILITSQGVPKLLDFGIAKVLDPEQWTESFAPTGSLVRLMTPEYASPEQVRAQPLAETTDIYSLGVLLYELLTGHRPYQLTSRAPHEIAQAICEVEPARPSTMAGRAEQITEPEKSPLMITPDDVASRRRTQPKRLRRTLAGDLDNIVLMAMRKEPERRYASVAALAGDIRRYLEGRTVAARKDTLVYRAGKLVKRNKAAVIAGGAAVVLTSSLGFLLFRSGMPLLNPVPLPPSVTPFTTLQGAETQPAFSPDGSRIAFVWRSEEGNSDIYVKARAGGELQRVTTDAAEDLSPVWSPDGSRIAFLRMKNGENAILVAPLPKGTHDKIADVFPTRLEGVGRQLDWSRDGSYLAVADKNSVDEPFSIYLVRAADGQKRKLTSPPARSIGDFSPAFSPDGKWMSFLRAPSSGITELYVTPLAGGEARQLTFDQREALSQCWTADSRGIVFVSSRVGNFNLWRIPAWGGVPQGIPGIAEGANEPTFTRDGRFLAYSLSFRDANIWRIDLTAEPVRPRILISSTQYDSSAQFSPDGSRIAFRSRRTGNHEIWVGDSQGRNQTQLTHFGGTLAGTPRWSPDGRSIAFDARPAGQADIFVISADGGSPRRLTFETAEDVVPSWSRDGKWVYFASRRSGSWQVWKTPAEGGPAVQVTQHGGFAAFETSDGKYVYYAKGRTEPGLYRMPAGGGEEQIVFEGLRPGYWGYWALANDGFYFADTPEPGVSAGISFFRFHDRRLRLIAKIEKPLTIGDSSMAVSPDGRTLLYTQVDQEGSDIMLAEMR